VVYSVVIPHYNTPGLLTALLENLDEVHAADDAGEECELIVVDDASAAVPALPSLRLSLRMERHAANRGYAASCNTGARAARGDYFVFLNTDVTVLPGFFTALAASGEIDVGGFRIEDPRGRRTPSCRRFPTCAAFFFHRGSLLGRLFPRSPFLRRYLMGDGAYEEAEWVSGAAMIVRRAVFESVGGFDEGFRLYFEDVDFCRRAVAAGYRVRYLADIGVRHAGGSSTALEVRRAVMERHRSMWRYYRKHMRRGWMTDCLAFPAILLRGALLWLLKIN